MATAEIFNHSRWQAPHVGAFWRLLSETLSQSSLSPHYRCCCPCGSERTGGLSRPRPARRTFPPPPRAPWCPCASFPVPTDLRTGGFGAERGHGLTYVIVTFAPFLLKHNSLCSFFRLGCGHQGGSLTPRPMSCEKSLAGPLSWPPRVPAS